MKSPVRTKRLIVWLVIVLVLVIIGVGFYWNIEPNPLPLPKGQDRALGVATTTQLIDSIETLLDKPGGYLRNDVMPPGVFMDNIPSWEYGALIQLRDFTHILRNQLSRPQAQSVRDDDLAHAEPRLNVSSTSWIFPRAESSYQQAADYLKHYRLRLEGKAAPQAYFLNRTRNLDLWLQIVSRRLGSLTQELAQSGAEEGSLSLFRARRVPLPQESLRLQENPPPSQNQTPPPTGPGETSTPQTDNAPPQGEAGQGNAQQKQLSYSWLQADNYFYRARGAAWALLNLCRGIEVDFHDQLVEKEALDSFQFLEQTLEASQKAMTSPIVMSGDYFSVLPNHPLTMAAFMASANSTVINIRRLMIAD
jgi:hypothetical protein